ncbi:hypothetical protein U1Q18_042824 [Sarracenia purpurea var. burkii]
MNFKSNSGFMVNGITCSLCVVLIEYPLIQHGKINSCEESRPWSILLAWDLKPLHVIPLLRGFSAVLALVQISSPTHISCWAAERVPWCCLAVTVFQLHFGMVSNCCQDMDRKIESVWFYLLLSMGQIESVWFCLLSG